MREAELIARARGLFPRAGDDAAVVGEQVMTTDMLVEGVDFTRDVPLASIARKSLAVNVSDVAAMGGVAQYALVAIGMPPEIDGASLLDELARAARDLGIEIVGGDLSRADCLVLSVTMIGEAKKPVLRSGARAGDRLYVSRPLGGPAAGLYLLQHGWAPADAFALRADASMAYSQREFAMAAILRQLEPEPESALGPLLPGTASACIDVSDGLSTDVHHLCEASEVGAEISRERIPLFPGLLTDGTALGIPVAESVLHGGEEYALLFTSRMRESELSARFGRPVYAIGRITADRAVLLDGQPLAPRGWDHFAGT